jgi:hypothetical protein
MTTIKNDTGRKTNLSKEAYQCNTHRCTTAGGFECRCKISSVVKNIPHPLYGTFSDHPIKKESLESKEHSSRLILDVLNAHFKTDLSRYRSCCFFPSSNTPINCLVLNFDILDRSIKSFNSFISIGGFNLHHNTFFLRMMSSCKCKVPGCIDLNNLNIFFLNISRRKLEILKISVFERLAPTSSRHLFTKESSNQHVWLEFLQDRSGTGDHHVSGRTLVCCFEQKGWLTFLYSIPPYETDLSSPGAALRVFCRDNYDNVYLYGIKLLLAVLASLKSYENISHSCTSRDSVENLNAIDWVKLSGLPTPLYKFRVLGRKYTYRGYKNFWERVLFICYLLCLGCDVISDHFDQKPRLFQVKPKVQSNPDNLAKDTVYLSMFDTVEHIQQTSTWLQSLLQTPSIQNHFKAPQSVSVFSDAFECVYKCFFGSQMALCLNLMVSASFVVCDSSLYSLFLFVSLLFILRVSLIQSVLFVSFVSLLFILRVSLIQSVLFVSNHTKITNSI